MNHPLQNKLLQYAPEPPQKVWDAIAISLDEEVSTTLSERLHNFEEIPSAGVWNKLNTHLNNASGPAKIVTFFDKYRNPLKFSVAAAILIFLAVTTMLLLAKRTEPKNPIQEAVLSSDHQNNDVAQRNKRTNNPNSTEIERSVTERETEFKFRPQKAAGFLFIAKTFLPKEAKRKNTIEANASMDKYMVYSDGDGHAVKLPKKLFDFFSCAVEEIACKERIQQMQQKLAVTSLTTDFMGVLELLKNLKESQ